MWRDTLLIIAFALAALSYFRITPKRIVRYARSTKFAVARKGRYQRIFLLSLVVMTLYLVVFYAYRFDELRLDTRLFVMMGLVLVWLMFLGNVWTLSKTGEKTVRIMYYSVWLPLYIATVSLANMPLWQKVCYPLAGFCGGYGLRWLVDYIGIKLKSR